MKKVFKSRSTKVGVIGVSAASVTEIVQKMLTEEGIPPEVIALFAEADLKYWVLAAVVLVLAKISPDRDDVGDNQKQELGDGSR